MKEKFFEKGLLLSIIVIVLVCSYFFLINKKEENKADVITVEGIPNLNINKKSRQSSYLVFHSDKIVEVEASGKVVQRYEYSNEELNYMDVHQKPNAMNRLYINAYGEEYSNSYYTYDIQKRKFSRVDLEYMKKDVGIDNLGHYGKDVLLQTANSHVTGDSRESSDGKWKVTISNSTAKKNYETEYGCEPNGGNILQFGDYILYSVSSNDSLQDAFICLLNTKTGVSERIKLNKESEVPFDCSTLFSTDAHAYIIAHNGIMYIYDKNMNVETCKPYEQLNTRGENERFLTYQSGDTLALSSTKILQILTFGNPTQVEKEKSPMGILDLSGTPEFTEIKRDYLPRDKVYKLLYQDVEKGLLYILQDEYEESDGKILVLDNQTFDLIESIPHKDIFDVNFLIKL